MARLDLSIEIAAPPDRVAVFFVPQRMPYWYGAGMETHFEVLGGSADFQAGQKVRIVARVGRREVSHTAVVTQFEWGRVLEWKFQDVYGIRGMQRWEIEPGAASGDASDAAPATRVRLRDEYEMPGRMGRFMDWLVTRHAVKQRDHNDLAQLKKFAENVSAES
jgi:uncharacterized membrane protein